MSYTKYGELIRVLRIRHHEVMGDTAKLLKCKIPFVSAVESGKKNVPDTWAPLLIEHYSLSENEAKELYDAIEDSKTQVKLNLISATNSQRSLALQFQRSFDKLDEETANTIMKLLDQPENKK